ncbi:CHASE3 domain-containing protein, partial [Modestobacter roseus]
MRSAATPVTRRWFADRSVRGKILLAVGLAALTAALVGVLAVSRLGELRDAREAELSTSLPYMNALDDIGLTAKATANDERGYLLTGDEEFRAEVQERLEKIGGLFDVARGAAATSDELATLGELQDGVDAWSASIEAEFALLATDRGAAVTLAMGETRDLRKSYEEALAVAKDEAEAVLTEGAGYGEVVSSATRTLVVVCVIGVLLACLAGLVVAGAVTRGLQQLRRVAAAMAAGDLTAQTGITQRDEVGATAAAVDGAVLSLRTLVTSVAGSAGAVAASSEELSASSAQISASAEET